MRFIFITNSPDLADFAVTNGADRVMVDTELMGKVERQGHLSTVISRHTLDDIAPMRRQLPDTEIIVRVNPLHEGSQAEVDKAIALGADTLMLPMFRDAATVAAFCGLVGGRAKVCALVETVGAMNDLAAIVRVDSLTEVHIGLNDLHLELNSNFMFEPVADGLIDHMSEILRKAEIPFGIGGIARMGEGVLPSELVLAEHARVGSTGVILSRTFHRGLPDRSAIMAEMNFGVEIAKLRQQFAVCLAASPSALAALHEEVCARVRQIVADKRDAQRQ